MKQKLNKNILRVAIVLIITFSIVACVRSSTSDLMSGFPTSTVEISQKLVATNTPEIIPTATPTITPEPVQAPVEIRNNSYSFAVLLDYNKHTLDVEQSIQYTNQTGQALSEIVLVVAPNKEEEVFELESVSGDDNNPITDHTLEGIILSLNLVSPFAVGETIDISIKYTLTLPFNGGIFGYSKLQSNLSDWYPFVPPYDPETGWIVNQPAEVGEYLVYEMADFDLTLALTGGQGLIVAGSTEATPVAPDIYKMMADNSRNITFSVSDQYKLLTGEYGDTTVRAYFFNGDEAAGEAALEATGNALLLFATHFGVLYPHETLTIVEADFPDGMEYDGLYYLSKTYFSNFDGSYQNYLTLLSVHETAHQWWFGLVGSDQANEPWLDESLSTYSEYLYLEYYLPGLTDWWWDFRVDEYLPSGKVNMTIYDQNKLRPYINAVYLQGASFLHDLRGALGDDAFFAGLKTYVESYKLQNAKWEDFLKIMVNSQTISTDELLQEYFK